MGIDLEKEMGRAARLGMGFEVVGKPADMERIQRFGARAIWEEAWTITRENGESELSVSFLAMAAMNVFLSVLEHCGQAFNDAPEARAAFFATVSTTLVMNVGEVTGGEVKVSREPRE